MKEKFVYVCQQCGQTYSKWMGRCQECNAWNSIVEEREIKSNGPTKGIGLSETPRPLSQITSENFLRLTSDLTELDNVLGGGLVTGSVILLGGEPGIGKSTLLLQAAAAYANKGQKLLYVSGEESCGQIALRANRLEIANDNLYIVSETVLETIQNHIAKLKPDLLIVDSIQTVYRSALESNPGSVGQLRECSHQFISIAKSTGMTTFLVGHVTKDGAIAGPKVLEHMVDVVLYFEGTASQNFRLLRSIKNRFGSTNEIGVFEMLGTGMRQVDNPSEFFLSEKPSSIPGSVIGASVEGTRPILVEVQALVSSTSMAMPRRTAIGLDPNRLSLLVAILEKRGGFRLFDQDIYLNLAGGIKINEPAMDLAIEAALISSYTGKQVESGSVFFGEVGLGGEVRSVPKAELRIREAQRINLKKIYGPAKLMNEFRKSTPVELVGIDNVQQLSDFL